MDVDLVSLSAQRLTACRMAVDGDGRIRWANASCLTLLGYDERDLAGRSASEIAGWDSRCSHPRDQIELFTDRVGGVVSWLHAGGRTVRTIILGMAQVPASVPFFVLALSATCDDA